MLCQVQEVYNIGESFCMNDFIIDFIWMIKYFCYLVDDLNKQESENGNIKKKVVVKILKGFRLILLGRNDNIF